MRGIESLRCPECGALFPSEDELALIRRRRGRALVGAALVVIGAGAGVWRASEWRHRAPDWALCALVGDERLGVALASYPRTGAEWELRYRVLEGRATAPLRARASNTVLRTLPATALFSQAEPCGADGKLRLRFHRPTNLNLNVRATPRAPFGEPALVLSGSGCGMEILARANREASLDAGTLPMGVRVILLDVELLGPGLSSPVGATTIALPIRWEECALPAFAVAADR